MPRVVAEIGGGAEQGAATASRSPRGTPRRLRAWQLAALGRWEALGRPQDFLAEATPGAGKTTFALHVAKLARAPAVASPDPICIVCPTAHLRGQWQLAAHREGFQLCSEVFGRTLSRGYAGAVLTYQQVLADAARYRWIFAGGFVVLDECHHAGEGKSWAEALLVAFSDARHRLLLSGTAFRSDACRIPFVRYDGESVSVADYRYGYGDALRDGVVRPVYFVSYGGETTWYKSGRTHTAAFGDVVSREDASSRLRTALEPAGGWMRHAISRAHERLLETRRCGHPDAGGLVVCMDQSHARAVATCLKEVAGCIPRVALSDDSDSSAVIAQFAAGRDPWIIAVRQVSEGTDIPRLRVGVWATNASTELFFRQVVGRLVRVTAGVREQDAYLYLPADPQLLRHARALADERSHHLPQPSANLEIERVAAPGTAEPDFRSLGSSASEAEIVVGSRVLAPEELARARVVAEQCGLRLDDPVAFAVALRDSAGPGTGGDIPTELKRRALRALLSRRVREYCARTNAVHRDTYARLKRTAGRSVGRLDEVGLVRHIRMVEQWIVVAEGGVVRAKGRG
jgi:superfamily II DNA or RNA helicase